jgi:hypothetical protein
VFLGLVGWVGRRMFAGVRGVFGVGWWWWMRVRQNTAPRGGGPPFPFLFFFYAGAPPLFHPIGGMPGLQRPRENSPRPFAGWKAPAKITRLRLVQLCFHRRKWLSNAGPKTQK